MELGRDFASSERSVVLTNEPVRESNDANNASSVANDARHKCDFNSLQNLTSRGTCVPYSEAEIFER